MTDGDSEAAFELKEPNFPDVSIPTIYADGVGNFVPGKGVARFYLVRTDAAMNWVNSAVTRPVAQVILPMEMFIQTAVFFEGVLAELLKDEHITTEQIASVREQFARANARAD